MEVMLLMSINKAGKETRLVHVDFWGGCGEYFSTGHSPPLIPPGTASWGSPGCDATTIEKVCTYTAALVFRYYHSDILQTRELPGFTIFDKSSAMATESDAVLKQVFRDFINGCHILHYHRYVSHEQTND